MGKLSIFKGTTMTDINEIEIALNADAGERIALAQNPNTSTEVLDALSKDPDQFICMRVAANVNTLAHTLDRLSKNESIYVREFVAEHLNTSLETLLRLSTDPLMAYWIAGNPNTPAGLLKKYSTDEDANIRASVAVNPNTPIETLNLLREDENEDVRAAVSKNPNS
jgi:hypothetical protein